MHEFHRQRIIYFLTQCVSEVPHAPWDELWRRHPDLLVGVPTPNRRIDARGFHTVRDPPVFRPTRVEDIAWLNDAQPIIERLRVALALVPQSQRKNAQDIQRNHQQRNHMYRGEDRNTDRQPQPQDQAGARERGCERPHGRRRRRWWRFWRRNQSRIRHQQGPMNAQEEDRHIQNLVEQIIANDTLEEDIRQVILESLLNPLHGVPNQVPRNEDPPHEQRQPRDIMHEHVGIAEAVENQGDPDHEADSALNTIRIEEILSTQG